MVDMPCNSGPEIIVDWKMTWSRKVIRHMEKNAHSIQCEVMDWVQKAVFCKFMEDKKVNKGAITVF